MRVRTAIAAQPHRFCPTNWMLILHFEFIVDKQWMIMIQCGQRSHINTSQSKLLAIIPFQLESSAYVHMRKKNRRSTFHFFFPNEFDIIILNNLIWLKMVFSRFAVEKKTHKCKLCAEMYREISVIRKPLGNNKYLFIHTKFVCFYHTKFKFSLFLRVISSSSSTAKSNHGKQSKLFWWINNCW